MEIICYTAKEYFYLNVLSSVEKREIRFLEKSSVYAIQRSRREQISAIFKDNFINFRMGHLNVIS